MLWDNCIAIPQEMRVTRSTGSNSPSIPVNPYAIRPAEKVWVTDDVRPAPPNSAKHATRAVPNGPKMRDSSNAINRPKAAPVTNMGANIPAGSLSVTNAIVKKK
mmetsp:Transcript_18937/g.36402  ORF Transcript_18937/g.36402 Transcript_18937/m.36402 type:complete len:104 (+) Transcript_18937:628-939(+)